MPSAKSSGKKRGAKSATKKTSAKDSKYSVAAGTFLRFIKDAATRSAVPLIQEVSGKLQDQLKRGLEGSLNKADVYAQVQEEVRRELKEIREKEEREKAQADLEAERKKQEVLKMLKIVREEMKNVEPAKREQQ